MHGIDEPHECSSVSGITPLPEELLPQSDATPLEAPGSVSSYQNGSYDFTKNVYAESESLGRCSSCVGAPACCYRRTPM